MKALETKLLEPPQSKESEMLVLGCMLTNSNALSIGADKLQETDFYYKEHQLIFHALKKAFSGEKPADVHLIAQDLKRDGKLDAVGNVSYLTTLAQYVGTSAYIEEYADIVRKKSILRQMIQACHLIEKKSAEDPDDVYSTLDEAESLFFQIGQKIKQHPGITLQELLSGVYAQSEKPFLKDLQERQEKFQELGENEAPVVGIPTGFLDLDKLIQGIHPSHLIILAGRPSMGKTAFAINIVENLAINQKLPIGFFSLEMQSEEILHRMICSQSGVCSEKIKTGSLNGIEYQKVVEAVNSLQETTLILDDQPGIKVTDLRARARRLKEVYDVQAIVVDYLQLLSGPRGHYGSDNRHNEVSEISRMLKNLARELQVPVLCLSQLSRKVEERTDHRPMLSDLRESGSIEQDADIVLMLFRQEYYNKEHRPGCADVIVAKNRHGATGSAELAFIKELGRFQNYSKEANNSDDDFSY